MNKFQVIVMDPPYSFTDKLSMSEIKRGAESNYITMDNKSLLSLPINKIADPDGCILALWVPSSLLPFGLELMEKYKFNLKQTYVWVKTKKDHILDQSFMSVLKNTYDMFKSGQKLSNIMEQFSFNSYNLSQTLAFGMGRLFRQTHEIALIGINNTNIYKKLKNKSQRSVSFAPNLKHSAKPENLQDALELMFPNANYLEIFARQQRYGWTCLGNEVCNGEDIKVSLSKL